MILRPALLLLLLFLPLGALRAEQGDRKQPINLEADRVTVDDLKGEQLLEGNVVLTQGTITIRSNRIVITEDAYGFQQGVAYGGPDGLARFRQRRDDGAWVEGEGERIEYNTRTEVAELFQRAWVKNGEDEIRGDYIRYEGVSARYLATSGKDGVENSGRVSITLQPKSRDVAPAATVVNPSDTPEPLLPPEPDFPDRPQPR